MSLQWIPAPDLIPDLPTAERSAEVYPQHWLAVEMAKAETARQGQLIAVHEIRGAGFVLYRVPFTFAEYLDPSLQPTLVLPRR
jgi:hypothetical protein